MCDFMDFDETVSYAESSDFDDEGNLIATEPGSKLVFMLIQSSKCGWCRELKPVWQKLAKSKSVQNSAFMCTVSAEDNHDVVKKMLEGDFPFTLQGYPTIVVYKDGKFLEEYNGDRDYKSLKNYILSF